MDDYLSKPIRPRDVEEMIRRWLPEIEATDPVQPFSDPRETVRVPTTSHQRDTDTTSPGSEESDLGANPVVSPVESDESVEEVFNESDLLERLMGDRTLASTIAVDFLEDMIAQMDALRAAVDAEDFSAAQRLAHTIKGAAANIGAPLFRMAALNLEKAAELGDGATLRKGLPELEGRYGQLRETLIGRLNVITQKEEVGDAMLAV